MKDLKDNLIRIGMQYFAEDGDDDTDEKGGKGDDDQSDNNDDKSDKGKVFTEADVNAIVEKRIARERKKTEKEKADAEAEKNKSAEQKAKEKADKSAKEQADKISSMEQRLICYDNDVPKDKVSKVIKLAKAYTDDDTDFEAAIGKVKTDFPFLFKTGSEEDSDDEKLGTTGVHSKSSTSIKDEKKYLDNKYKNNPYYKG